MSRIITYLPELTELKKWIEQNPKLIKYYSKSEGFCGSDESIEYIQKIFKK